MERTAVTSHVLISVGYDPATRTLQVEFPRRQKEATRAVYNYHDVPPERFRELMEGKPKDGETKPSIGSYFLRMIRPNYKFTRIEEKENADGNLRQESLSSDGKTTRDGESDGTSQ